MCRSTVSRYPVSFQSAALLDRCVHGHDRFKQAVSAHFCRYGRVIRIRLNWINTDAHFLLYAQKEHYFV
jgi:hypothetical protein